MRRWQNELQQTTPEVFPWREGNGVEILVDGEQFYTQMLQALVAARHSICLEMYLIRSGGITARFIEAWITAARRGVAVQLLLDGYGSLGLGLQDRQRLQESGVQLVLYNPLKWWPLRRLLARQNLFRTHRKLLLVDGQVAFIGGAGITDQFLGKQAWRETVLKIQGPVVSDWQGLFNHNWRLWAVAVRPYKASDKIVASETICTDAYKARIATSNSGLHSEIKRALLAKMKHSERRVWLATAYFIPSRKLRRALRRAARRGVDVHLLLPGPVTDHPAVRRVGQRFYSRLLRHGVRIHEYQGRFMHTKMVLVDDWVSLGSCNLDRWNLRWNLEANQEIDSPVFAEQLATMFERDLSHSVVIDYARWRKRSTLQRLKEWFWGRLDLLLARLFYPQ